MTQEIIYTSAPRGLRPGSRGFCTVVSTSGLAKNLAERLEALSGYTHVFLPLDPNAALNPVAFSHLKLTIGGRTHHVLSRIAAAGLDYTQRSNKFAHHVVLDEGELPAGGPAWLLLKPGFVEVTWDGEPKVLPRGRAVPAGEHPPGICHAWQKATGDAGWGGALADTALTSSGQAAVIIYRPGIDVLPLLVESLALIQSNRRWQVTFSTYYTSLPSGTGCQWRCVLEGSAEAKSAGRLPGALVINLCEPLGRAADGKLAELARTGIPASAAAATLLEIDKPPLPPAVASTGKGMANRPYAAAADTFRLGPPAMTSSPIVAAELRPRAARLSRWRALIWPAIAASLIAVLLGSIACLIQFGGILWPRKQLAKAPPHPTQRSISANTSRSERPRSKQKSQASTAKALDGTDLHPTPNGDKATPLVSPEVAPEQPQAAESTPTESQTHPIAPVREPIEKEKSEDDRRLEAPQEVRTIRRVFALLPVTDRKFDFDLTEFADATEAKIDLLGGKDAMDTGELMLLKPDPNRQMWAIAHRTNKFMSPDYNFDEIAEFELTGKSLAFSWKTNNSEKANRLRNCVLRIVFPAKVVLNLQLREPMIVEGLRIHLDRPTDARLLDKEPKEPFKYVKGDRIFLEARIDNLPPPLRPESLMSVPVRNPVILQFGDPSAAGLRLTIETDAVELGSVRYAATFLWKDKNNALVETDARLNSLATRITAAQNDARRRLEDLTTGATARQRGQAPKKQSERIQAPKDALLEVYQQQKNDLLGFRRDVVDPMHGIALIQFRLFLLVAVGSDTETVEIDAVRTKGWDLE